MMDSSFLAAGVWTDVLVYGFRALFFVSAILLMTIVLLQEGKGGGLASALGGQGAETFGVSSGGVNRVTLFLAGLFLVSALGHALAFDQGVVRGLRRESQGRPAVEDEPLEDPDEEGDDGAEAPGGGGKAPGGKESPGGGGTAPAGKDAPGGGTAPGETGKPK
jgi:preprotein translocase subunit SecG